MDAPVEPITFKQAMMPLEMTDAELATRPGLMRVLRVLLVTHADYWDRISRPHYFVYIGYDSADEQVDALRVLVRAHNKAALSERQLSECMGVGHGVHVLAVPFREVADDMPWRRYCDLKRNNEIVLVVVLDAHSVLFYGMSPTPTTEERADSDRWLSSPGMRQSMDAYSAQMRRVTAAVGGSIVAAVHAKVCAQCGAAAAKKRCAACGTCYYCNAACQRAHWADGGHREHCTDCRFMKMVLARLTDTSMNVV
jgi:hypothetical protein